MYQVKSLLFLLVTLVIALAHKKHDKDIKCKHTGDEYGHQFVDVEEGFISPKGRNMQDVVYPNLRMTADYGYMLANTSQAYTDYFKNDLIPDVFDYLRGALKVKYPLTKPLKVSYTTLCGLPTPYDLLNVGITTDFHLILDAEASVDDTYVAMSSTCYLSAVSKRALVAKTLVNTNLVDIATNDELIHEKNVYLMLHEIIHTLGFSSSMFKYFVDEFGDTRTDQYVYKLVNGVNRTYINVAPLTTKLRTHFGCSSIPGAALEDDGESATAGSHFERRNFLYEALTSGAIHGRRISEFTLAMLEGSGWYVANYSFAEPFHFGKGQGCTFLDGNCTASTFAFDEFCKNSARGCTANGRGGGGCQSDTKTDGCRYVYPSLNYDCENDDASLYTRLPNLQAFGRDAGSKCFSGNLTNKTTDTMNSFCFKYNCSGTGLSTVLTIQVGTTKINCTKEANVAVSGYKGFITCPDPLSFCQTAGLKYCPRGCLGRGSCVNNKCVCKTGYTGVDCSKKTI